MEDVLYMRVIHNLLNIPPCWPVEHVLYMRVAHILFIIPPRWGSGTRFIYARYTYSHNHDFVSRFPPRQVGLEIVSGADILNVLHRSTGMNREEIMCNAHI